MRCPTCAIFLCYVHVPSWIAELEHSAPTSHADITLYQSTRQPGPRYPVPHVPKRTPYQLETHPSPSHGSLHKTRGDVTRLIVTRPLSRRNIVEWVNFERIHFDIRTADST